jgi:hypothetical protein
LTLNFELKSIKKISADLKSEQKYYQKEIDKKSIWDEIIRADEYALASSKNNTWFPRGLYSLKNPDDNIFDTNSYYCYENQNDEESLTGDNLQEFIKGARGVKSGVTQGVADMKSGIELYKDLP